jgi:hypothetical protein
MQGGLGAQQQMMSMGSPPGSQMAQQANPAIAQALMSQIPGGQ